MKRFLRNCLIYTILLLIWSNIFHFFFIPEINDFRQKSGISVKANKMLNSHLKVWSDENLRAEILGEMRKLNPEWDFMSRTFLVLSLSNSALREPKLKDQALNIIDAIIEDTIKSEETGSIHHFLLNYSHNGKWIIQPPQSVFIDGEIALMLGARRMLNDSAKYKKLMTLRCEKLLEQMKTSPVLCGESYPDECWIFCNSIAMAALKIHSILDERKELNSFFENWLSTAKEKLLDKNGLLMAAFHVDGKPHPAGPCAEGSSTWLASYMLKLPYPEFAQNQYKLAKKTLGRKFIGFGYGREWPEGIDGYMDIDSGPVIPILGASASSSGLAMIAASGFDDEEFLKDLITSLNAAGFSKESDKELRYQASNLVGDAVILYALTNGALWQKVRELEQ